MSDYTSSHLFLTLKSNFQKHKLNMLKKTSAQFARLTEKNPLAAILSPPIFI